MILKAKVFNDKYNLLLFLLITVVSLFIQYVIILRSSDNSIYVLIGLNLILFIMVLYKGYIQNLAVFLILINFLPLLYLDNEFHYKFAYEVLTAFPLIILTLIAVLHYFSKSNIFLIKLTYLQKPILFLVLYFSIIAIVGFLGNNDILRISIQLFHFLLYLLIFPIYYLFYKREYYHTTLAVLLIISVLIAFEYILFNQVLLNFRFVTFQSGFLPIVSGIIFAYIILSKNLVYKIVATILLFIVIAGTFVTLTRTLWVTTILVLFFTWIFYLISKKNLSIKKIVFYLIILTLPLYLVRDMGGVTRQQVSSGESVQYRTQSVANPLEDSSFLMRVEFSYYALQRFVENPVLGNGLHDYITYKIFSMDSSPNYYMDNSWLYILWKGGIIGFLLFLWLYVRFFKTTYFVFNNSKDFKTKYICLGILGGFLGISLLAFLSPLLIKYKTNALITFIFAYVEFERYKLDSTTKLKRSIK